MEVAAELLVVDEVARFVDVVVDTDVLGDGAVVADVVDDPQAAIEQANASPANSAIGRSAFTGTAWHMVGDDRPIPSGRPHPATRSHPIEVARKSLVGPLCVCRQSQSGTLGADERFAPGTDNEAMAKDRPQPHYARVYEIGDSVILCCAYCGVKLKQGDALIKVWVASRGNLQDIHEQRSEHDRRYHLRWWKRN